MANIFRYEANIDDCNANLYHYLYLAADSEEVVDMSDLICRYAYDMLFSTTVGLPPGFLKDGPRSTTKLQDASNAWKSNAILQGSYFRFFPNMSGLRKKIKHVLDDIPDVESECILRQMQRIVGENENISSK